LSEGLRGEHDDARRPVEEIGRLVDDRSLEELQEQAENALIQILYRAHCGDEMAVAKYQ